MPEAIASSSAFVDTFWCRESSVGACGSSPTVTMATTASTMPTYAAVPGRSPCSSPTTTGIAAPITAATGETMPIGPIVSAA